MVIPEPTQSQDILDIHIYKVQLFKTPHGRLIKDREKVLESLAANSDNNNLDTVLMTSEIQK